VELLKQPLNSPMPVEEQVVSIFAGTKGYLDDVPVQDVRRFEQELLEHMRSRNGSMLAGIRQNPKADVPADLAGVVAAFKKSFTPTLVGGVVADPTKSSAGEVGEAASKKTLATE
jgi:F-type H+-transporting ATPase subunit alpha